MEESSYLIGGKEMQIKQKIGSNVVYQEQSFESEGLLDIDTVLKSWDNSISYSSASGTGLRPAQLGALFSIKAHWTISQEPATIVMPTGTGKTETMIATVVSEILGRTLIVVPSHLLRKQTRDKFLTFGVLQRIGVIKESAYTPTVGMLHTTPKESSELKEILEKSNVIITTMSLLQRFSDEYLNLIASKCDALIIDEAHHIAASTWSTVKYKLRSLKCLQFTATPFRSDGKKLDGKIIYNFPLFLAQQQGYFQPINFLPLLEFDEEQGDMSIATAAIKQLKQDLEEGYQHIVLVRAKDKSSANRLYYSIYRRYFDKYNPVLIHSDISASERTTGMKALKDGTSKIVVCVDMFGEGIDIPNLKIAAVHDKYKSLPITLQFIGRFARSSKGLGTATVITNIANDDLNEALTELYAQDSDWNNLLHVMASREISKELSLQELAEGFNISSLSGMTIQQLKAKVSMVAYKTQDIKWRVEAIYNLFDDDKSFISINNDKKIIVIVEKTDSKVEWTTFKGINDTNWHLHIIYWNEETKMFFINSTQKSISDILAKALFSSYQKTTGENVFRCLYDVKRLMLGTVGLKSAIDGPIRYRMFAGIDIAHGITESQKETSFKSNLFGAGYNGHGKVSIGCSYKGRIWARWIESIDYWVEWCNDVAAKLQNETIDPAKILEGVLVPQVITERPMVVPYGIEWPLDMELINDRSFIITNGINEFSIYELDIKLLNYNESGPLTFSIKNDLITEEYILNITEGNYEFKAITSSNLIIKKGKNEWHMDEFFNDNPPRIKFVDQSMLEGNLLVRVTTVPPVLKDECIIKWNWDGVDIHKESQGNARETDSIQYHVIQNLISKNIYSVVFDDDGAGEIADIVTISEEDKIGIQMYHCKYAHGNKPGSRVADLYEVCGQAEKSVKWCQEPSEIIDRLIHRESLRSKQGGTRFEVGDLRKLREIKNKMRVFRTSMEIFIVQPGIDFNALTDDMIRILNGTASYLMDTYSIELKVIGS